MQLICNPLREREEERNRGRERERREISADICVVKTPCNQSCSIPQVGEIQLVGCFFLLCFEL